MANSTEMVIVFQMRKARVIHAIARAVQSPAHWPTACSDLTANLIMCAANVAQNMITVAQVCSVVI